MPLLRHVCARRCLRRPHLRLRLRGRLLLLLLDPRWHLDGLLLRLRRRLLLLLDPRGNLNGRQLRLRRRLPLLLLDH